MQIVAGLRKVASGVVQSYISSTSCSAYATTSMYTLLTIATHCIFLASDLS